MKRRDFLKLAGAGSIGLAVAGTVDTLFNSAFASVPDLVVAKGSSPSGITGAAIQALGGIKRFIEKGDTVVVKPNIAWDRLPEQAANTNPDVVAEIVRLCIMAGAERVKVFDRTVNDPRRCYLQSGIKKASERYGAEVTYVDERRFRNVSLNGRTLKKWPLYTEVIEADKVINVPVAKHHGLAKITMAMKNWMGVMGGDRSRIHQKLDQSLVDVSTAIRPVLTILDAVRILTANGPQGGSIDDVKILNTVVAGVDQVAVDSYGATLFGMKGSDLGYVRLAAEQGLGVMDLNKLNIKTLNI